MNLEVESKAGEIGWQPKELFKGDPEKWVDAEEFLRRGEEVLPIVRATNRRLKAQLDQQTAQIARLEAAAVEQRQSMGELVKFSQEQLKEKLDEQRRTLTAKLREAQRAEDDAAADDLQNRIDQNRDRRAELDRAPAPAPASAQPAISPEVKAVADAWQEKNPWFGGNSRADKAKTAAAMRFAAEAEAGGKRGQALFDAVDEALAEVYPAPTRRDPTEDGRPSGSSGSSSSASSGFKALPADAQAQARAQASKFVGPNKIFKTEKEWLDHFAAQYEAN